MDGIVPEISNFDDKRLGVRRPAVGKPARIRRPVELRYSLSRTAIDQFALFAFQIQNLQLMPVIGYCSPFAIRRYFEIDDATKVICSNELRRLALIGCV